MSGRFGLPELIQVSDSPMPLPDDAMDKISMYSPRSPSSPTIYTAPGGFPAFGGGLSAPVDSRPRSKSQIKVGSASSRR